MPNRTNMDVARSPDDGLKVLRAQREARESQPRDNPLERVATARADIPRPRPAGGLPK